MGTIGNHFSLRIRIVSGLAKIIRQIINGKIIREVKIIYFEYALLNRILSSCNLLKIGKLTLLTIWLIVCGTYIANESARLKYPKTTGENFFPISMGYIFRYKRCINEAPSRFELYANKFLNELTEKISEGCQLIQK